MKKILLFISLLLGFAGSSYADDSFSVDNITLPQNGEADVVVRFSLDAGSTCSGYTFWLQVPTELAFGTYIKNDETRVTYTLGDCYDGNPTFTPNINEGYLKVACTTANSDPLTSQTGILVTFVIKANGTPAVGSTFNCSLTKATISNDKGSVHDVANATFTVTIAEPVDLRTVLDETSTVAPAAATGVDVRVKRTIKANEWSTICLPFAMTEAQCKAAFGNDVQLGDFTSWSSEDNTDGDIVKINVGFTSVTAIEANHPYIILVSAGLQEFTADGVDIDAEEEPTVQVGKKKNEKGFFIGSYIAGTEIPEDDLFLNSSMFWYSKGNTKMKAFRGYFEFADVLTEVEEASSRIMFEFNEQTTGIRTVTSSEDGKYFDLQGRGVKPTKKGLYIKDGKKVVIK